MSNRIIFREAADADQDDIADYLTRVSGDDRIGHRWLTAVKREGEYAVEYPTQTPPLIGFSNRPDGPLRRRIITGFRNYLLFYRFDDETVTVTRILHGSRDLRRVPDL
ncbi:MAG: type II toxin-antitoxin system RelE/ParE family toxin [Planctomycetota bacterium]